MISVWLPDQRGVGEWHMIYYLWHMILDLFRHSCLAHVLETVQHSSFPINKKTFIFLWSSTPACLKYSEPFDLQCRPHLFEVSALCKARRPFVPLEGPIQYLPALLSGLRRVRTFICKRSKHLKKKGHSGLLVIQVGHITVLTKWPKWHDRGKFNPSSFNCCDIALGHQISLILKIQNRGWFCARKGGFLLLPLDTEAKQTPPTQNFSSVSARLPQIQIE